MSYGLIAFDLDDTLAVSKSTIQPRMAGLLGRLLERVPVCVISGGKFEQFDAQVLRHLDLSCTELSRLHLMPTCGTRYYRWRDGGWRLIYAEDFTADQKNMITAVLTAGAIKLGLWESNPWGDIIEDRESQITFSALGQRAPAEKKHRWDPDGSKKEMLRAYASEQLPDLEVRSGGSTSVDITKKGVDKAYGMRKMLDVLGLSIKDVLFIGDRLDPGGNDYPVRAMGIDCVSVHGWQDTANHVARLLAAEDAVGVIPA